MAVGCFIGIRSPYIDEAQDYASAYLVAINAVLVDNGLAGYPDPEKPLNVYSDVLCQEKRAFLVGERSI